MINSILDMECVTVQNIFVISESAKSYGFSYKVLRYIDFLRGKTTNDCHENISISELSLKEKIITFNSSLVGSEVWGKADVLIDISGTNNSCLQHSIPRFGIWTPMVSNIHDKVGNRYQIPYELLTNSSKSVTALLIQTEANSEKVAISSNTMLVGTSLTESMNYCLWKVAEFVPRKLKLLSDIGEIDFFNNLESFNNQQVLLSEQQKNIGELNLFFLMLRYLLGNVSRLVKKVFFLEQWILMYAFSKHDEFQFSMKTYHKLIPPKDRFWADPHVVYDNNQHYIFVEELMYLRQIAHISCMEVDKNGELSPPVKIIEQPYHMSYPHTFKHNDQWYMIPETSQNQTVELYRAKQFPYEWVFERNLMENISAFDVTLLEYDGVWWLFATMAQQPGASACEELYIFHADSPIGLEWNPHPMNPVISDATSARPAGKLFIQDGKLYRPSQNCTPCYGYATKINHVTVLNKYQYEEECINEIEPVWDEEIVATHTFNKAKGLNIIDAVIYRGKVTRNK